MDFRDAPVDQAELVRIRRQLHMYPETKWDLPRTTALVREELERSGIFYEADKYAPTPLSPPSIRKLPRLPLRCAPIWMRCPSRSATKISPTARESRAPCTPVGTTPTRPCCWARQKPCTPSATRLRCRVKLLFQPCEEGRPSGARVMCEHGVMEGVDCVLMCHVNCGDPVHVVSCCSWRDQRDLRRLQNFPDGRRRTRGVAPLRRGRAGGGREIVQWHPAIGQPGSGSLRRLRDERVHHARGQHRRHQRGALRIGRLHPLPEGRYHALGNGAARAPGAADRRGVRRALGDRLVGRTAAQRAQRSRALRGFRASAEKVVGPERFCRLLPSPGAEDFAYYEQRKPGLLFGLGMRNPQRAPAIPLIPATGTLMRTRFPPACRFLCNL